MLSSRRRPSCSTLTPPSPRAHVEVSRSSSSTKTGPSRLRRNFHGFHADRLEMGGEIPGRWAGRDDGSIRPAAHDADEDASRAGAQDLSTLSGVAGSGRCRSRHNSTHNPCPPNRVQLPYGILVATKSSCQYESKHCVARANNRLARHSQDRTRPRAPTERGSKGGRAVSSRERCAISPRTRSRCRRHPGSRGSPRCCRGCGSSSR